MIHRPVFHFSATGKKICDLCRTHISGKSSMRKHQETPGCKATANVKRLTAAGMVQIGGWDTFFERVCDESGLPTEYALVHYKKGAYGRQAYERKGFHVPGWVEFLFARSSPRDLQGVVLPNGRAAAYDETCTMASIILARAKFDLAFREYCTTVVGIGGTRALAALAIAENPRAFAYVR